jgi:hypothetical protein
VKSQAKRLCFFIDVEGYDMQVAQGACRTLARTRFVVIEGSPEDSAMMRYFRMHGFSSSATTPHNMIFKRPVDGSDAVVSEPVSRPSRTGEDNACGIHK